MLELAIEYVGYRHAEEKEDTAENNPQLMRILKAKNKVDILPQTPWIEQPRTRPDQGHPSGRAEISYGYENEQQFFQVSLRPVLHTTCSIRPAAISRVPNLHFSMQQDDIM